MAVLAVFRYTVKPGRMQDFLFKLGRASSSQFNSPVMPKSARLFRSTVPGPDKFKAVLVLEYEDMAAYGARTAFENGNPEWRKLFEATPESPEVLDSVELLTEFGG